MKIQTAAQCVCKTCPGSGDGWVCTCFCHAHSQQSRKESAFFNLMGGLCESGDKAEALTDEQLMTEFCENIGQDERVDSWKCALVGEVLHRFKKYATSPRNVDLQKQLDQILSVATGQEQVAFDDTLGMQWIAEYIVEQRKIP